VTFQGNQARRPPHRTAHQVRSGHQPHDRQGARPDDPAVAPAAGGPGDRVIDRRTFLGALAGGLLAAPLAAEGQQSGKTYHVGIVHPGGPYHTMIDGLKDGLKELWHRLLRRSASESGRLCHADGAHGRGDRCRRPMVLKETRSNSQIPTPFPHRFPLNSHALTSVEGLLGQDELDAAIQTTSTSKARRPSASVPKQEPEPRLTIVRTAGSSSVHLFCGSGGHTRTRSGISGQGSGTSPHRTLLTTR